MPAYFSVVFQFRRKDLYPGFVSDFYRDLGQAGFAFQSGCYEAENMSFEEIVRYNQARLDDNFELGYEEDGRNDYKQVYFSHPEYEEVRGFWMNFRGIREIRFCLIIPEWEMMEWETLRYFKMEKLAPVQRMAESMWSRGNVAAIQTELELDDGAVRMSALQGGAEPSVRPFAVIPAACGGHAYVNQYTVRNLEANGLLLTDEMMTEGNGSL
ncbi:hypothetical protein [Hungatella effluvii]|uniref:hypothetical protein n=1 Tax=Hungatella effluvii TaxID=1096246 RepID=UPI0022E45BEC|nr:hypothetical protein [Hungatella effluvii]